MELIRINEKKLKIMLSSLDMKNYALDASSMSCATEETRRAFRNILHDAGIRGGFDTASEKIFVQFYPSREGGCEMFVTNLTLNASGATSTATGDLVCSVPQVLPPMKERSEPMVFLFDSLSLLLRACSLLLQDVKREQHGKRSYSSAAYRSDGGNFFLFLTPKSISAEEKKQKSRLIWLLGEFGTPCEEHVAQLYIKEHSSPLCARHAVETLGQL